MYMIWINLRRTHVNIMKLHCFIKNPDVFVSPLFKALVSALKQRAAQEAQYTKSKVRFLQRLHEGDTEIKVS